MKVLGKISPRFVYGCGLQARRQQEREAVGRHRNTLMPPEGDKFMGQQKAAFKICYIICKAIQTSSICRDFEKNYVQLERFKYFMRTIPPINHVS